MDGTGSGSDRWRFAADRLIVKLFKFRIWIAPAVMLLALPVFAIWDPAPWKLIWIGAVLVCLGVLSVFEYRRVKALREVSSVTVVINLVLMFLVQGAMVYITGGIMSPLIVIFIPMALASGMLVQSYRQVLLVIAVPACIAVLLAGSALYGWVPYSLPAFFELGSALVTMPVLVWGTAGFLVFILIMTSKIASLVRRAIEQQVREGLAARQESLESLASRNRELQSVSRTIAHELKNPLASIQGLAQLLARSAEPGKPSERLEVMQREIARMREVLDGFRDFTRPFTALGVERCDLCGLLREVVALHEGLAGSRGLALETVSEPMEIECDPHKVKQALVNLLQNALEASPPGGTVTLRAGAWRGEGVRIEIQDAGPGLSEELSEHLFEPGFTTKEHGTGIGLVVARSIAEQHGGCVEIDSGASGGCVASLSLPARPSPAALPEEGT
ncbi:MAG: HAMP domain-containing histidine kinase [Deltaproteobacteria bacterium]|nr:HAMP domain-containing histidine kinase [Deltaproteobacteria bacterium]